MPPICPGHTHVPHAAELDDLDHDDPKRFKLSVEWVVYYYKKERARRHPWLVGLYVGFASQT